jgi:hypothetical protein
LKSQKKSRAYPVLPLLHNSNPRSRDQSLAPACSEYPFAGGRGLAPDLPPISDFVSDSPFIKRKREVFLVKQLNFAVKTCCRILRKIL